MSTRQLGWRQWGTDSLVSGDLADDGGGGEGDPATGCTANWDLVTPTASETLLADATLIRTTGYDWLKLGLIFDGTVDSGTINLDVRVAIWEPTADGKYFIGRQVYIALDGADTTAAAVIAGGGLIPSGYAGVDIIPSTSDAAPKSVPASMVPSGKTASGYAWYHSYSIEADTAGSDSTLGIAVIPLSGAVFATYRVEKFTIQDASASLAGCAVYPIYNLVAMTRQ